MPSKLPFCAPRTSDHPRACFSGSRTCLASNHRFHPCSHRICPADRVKSFSLATRCNRSPIFDKTALPLMLQSNQYQNIPAGLPPTANASMIRSATPSRKETCPRPSLDQKALSVTSKCSLTLCRSIAVAPPLLSAPSAAAGSRRLLQSSTQPHSSGRRSLGRFRQSLDS